MKKYLIVCQCATNKGDRAIAEYIISQLSSNSDIEITLSTTNPKLWNNLLDKKIRVIGTGYKSLTVGKKNRFLIKVLRSIDKLLYERVIFPSLLNRKSHHFMCKKISKSFITVIKQSDVVIITGGHHITSLRNRNALFSITYDIGLVSLYAKKYFLWSQTIGPLCFSDQAAQKFFSNILKQAERVYIRDNNSKNCIQEHFGELNNIVKSYDSVFGFGNHSFCEYDQRMNKVGISIFNGLKKAVKTYDYIAYILDWYAYRGYEIEFFRMEWDDKEEEDIKKVISKMKNKANITIYPFCYYYNRTFKRSFYL